MQEIRRLNNAKTFKIHIFAGTECDILADGSLDYPNEILKQLDFVIASVHSSLRQDEKKMTDRIIKALENPYTTMLGHATSRLLLERDAASLDLDRVIDAAIRNHKIIEINGQPKRMDLDWRYWKKASEKGLLTCINCDAHADVQLDYIELGVNIARKGWLTKK